jgi:hypothetical protein
MIFNWLGKGIDENLDVTTLWSTYMGCNACFCLFWFGNQKLQFIYF